MGLSSVWINRKNIETGSRPYFKQIHSAREVGYGRSWESLLMRSRDNGRSRRIVSKRNMRMLE
jgi:hypothetical protein